VIPTPSAAVPVEAQSILTADSVGAGVPRIAHGAVHSVFRRACNIEMRTGELVTLLALEFGNLPCGIRCAPPDGSFDGRLRRGQTATIEGAVLHVPAARLCVDLSRAPVWHCDSFAIDVRDSAAVRALAALRATLCGHTPKGGFAPLLFTPVGARTPLERSIAGRLIETLPVLENALARRDPEEFAAGLARIIGVGVGLTPSGDDFVVGLLAALRSRAGHEPGVDALLRQLASLLPPLTLGTHAISRQQLLDAIHGRFAQRLSEVLRALAQDGDVSEPARKALLSGHSSGADTLSGLLFGLSLAAPPARGSRQSFALDPTPAQAAL
jgi:hypothetical protein